MYIIVFSLLCLQEYITEKDKHIEGELKRIKTSYEESLRKMQQRLENVLKNTNNTITTNEKV